MEIRRRKGIEVLKEGLICFGWLAFVPRLANPPNPLFSKGEWHNPKDQL